MYMRVLVYGLGALGTVYSCLLKNAGHHICGVDFPQVAEAIQQSGVKIEGIWGEHHACLDQVVSSLEELDSKDFDLVIITVKAYETAAAAMQLSKMVGEKSYVLLAQNGYGNFETARQYIAPQRLILGRVIFGAETIAAGFSKVTVIADDVILGSPDNLIDMEALEKIAGLCTAAGIPTRASREVMKYVWGKIIYNSALNPLGAILEVHYGKLAEMEASRQIMNSIIREIFAVLEAINQPTLWDNADVYLKAFYEQMVPTTASHHASMLQDIQRGRRTEIDALNGAVVMLGQKYGIDTPVNRVITSVLKAKESY